MIKTPLTINGQDFSRIITGIRYNKEVTYEQVLTTMDGTEHYIGRRIRPILEFEIMLTPGQSSADYTALTTSPLLVTYQDPDLGYLENKQFRLDCNLDKAFEVRNASDGLDYYSSGTIRLRALEVY